MVAKPGPVIVELFPGVNPVLPAPPPPMVMAYGVLNAKTLVPETIPPAPPPPNVPPPEPPPATRMYCIVVGGGRIIDRLTVAVVVCSSASEAWITKVEVPVDTPPKLVNVPAEERFILEGKLPEYREYVMAESDVASNCMLEKTVVAEYVTVVHIGALLTTRLDGDVTLDVAPEFVTATT
jgi:hypothetical protein